MVGRATSFLFYYLLLVILVFGSILYSNLQSYVIRSATAVVVNHGSCAPLLTLPLFNLVEAGV